MEKQAGTHGFAPRSDTRNPRPAFAPKLPARPRQRGALPPSFAGPASFPQLAGASLQSSVQHIPQSQLNAPPRQTAASSTQQDASLKALIPLVEEQTLKRQLAASSTPSTRETVQGQFPMQNGVVPLQRGSLNNKKRNNRGLLQEGELPNAGSFSRSWHRLRPPEVSHQRGALPHLPHDQGQNPRPRQRGAIGPPFQEQALHTPSAHTSPLPGPPFVPPLAAMEHMVFPPFLHMKPSSSAMWLQLEGAIENRERILMGMKAEKEKALSQVKILKTDALKEREEVEARKAGVSENTEIISKQTRKIKSVREGLEQISTDLSVQVAELNHLLQRVQEQQRVLKVLESLKDHHDATNDNDSFMTKNLQDCEVKLATMERELEASKQTSELLEKAACKQMGDLEEIEGGCGPPYLANNASSNNSVVSSTLAISKGTTEILSETKMDSGASWLNGERETVGHAAALKQPKLEVIS